MKYKIVATTLFRRDLKTMLKRKVDMQPLNDVVDFLAMGNVLPEKNRDHALTGDWKEHRECHVAPDWLLIYKVERGLLVLTLVRTGTHSDLFDL